MDRKSWLWRRKSSDKIAVGETDSSESLSSHSERFSDDQIVTSNRNQLPEAEKLSEALSEKLTEALANIRVKDNLVKQHSKVAEEAVSGWERTENEVSALKKLNDAVKQKNLILDERVTHLDGALKECLRQLRQSRDEQDENISEAVARNNTAWEGKKIEFETQLAELRSELENSKADVKEENSVLKLQLVSKDRELNLRTNERDLSIRAAENASKLHLETVRKVTKLEAECYRLKAMTRKSEVVVNFANQSDTGERILYMDLMDDFLEMEKLAGASPETQTDENVKQYKHESVVKQASDVEENLKKVTAQKLDLQIALEKCQIQLKESRDQIDRANEKLVDLETKLVEKNNLSELLDEAEKKAAGFYDQLTEVNAAKSIVAMQVEDANKKKVEAESRIKIIEHELRTLKEEAEIERKYSKEAAAKCEILEAELSKLKLDTYSQTSAFVEEIRVVRTELENTNLKKIEAERQVNEMKIKLQRLQLSINDLEQEVESEREHSREAINKCISLEREILKIQQDSQPHNQEKELEEAASKFSECQKTIASLSYHLKSLASFDDLLANSEQPLAI